MASFPVHKESCDGVKLKNVGSINYENFFDLFEDWLIIFKKAEQPTLCVYDLSSLNTSQYYKSVNTNVTRLYEHLLPAQIQHVRSLQSCDAVACLYIAAECIDSSTDSTEHKIFRIRPHDGNVVSNWNVLKSADLSRMSVHAETGRVVLPRMSDGVLLEYSRDGQFLRKINISSALQFPGSPFFVAVESDVSYVVIHHGNRTTKDTTLTWVRTAGSEPERNAITVYQQWTLNYAKERLFSFDAAHALVTYELSSTGTNSIPSDMTVSASPTSASPSTTGRRNRRSAGSTDHSAGVTLGILNFNFRTYRRLHLHDLPHNFDICPLRCDMERGRLVINDHGTFHYYKFDVNI